MFTSPVRGFRKEGENPGFFDSAVLPEQFFSSPFTAYSKRPEVALMRAVLEDALACFQLQFIDSSVRRLRLAREAEAWFTSDATSWPFAFINICIVLGLDPTCVRQELKQLHAHHTTAGPRKKRRVDVTGRIERVAV